jgi:hypothetical protein
MNNKQVGEVIKDYLSIHNQNLFSLIIFISGLVAYLPGSQIPSLFGDDWGFYVNGLGKLACPEMITDWRPLDMCVISLSSKLFGLNIELYHILLLFLSVIVPLLFFYFLERLFRDQTIVNLLITEILIVYPIDIAHHWLNIVNYRIVAIFLLIGGIFLINYWRDSSWKYLGLSTLFLIISVGVYDIHLGILILGSFLLFLMPQKSGKRYRIGLLAPMAIAVGSIILHILTPGTVYGGWSLKNIIFSPGIIIGRIIHVFRLNFYDGWRPIIGKFLHINSNIKGTILFLILLILAFMFGLLFIWLQKSVKQYNPISTDFNMKKWMRLLLFGLLFMGAGYIPIILFSPLDFNFVNSRLHIMASFGGAIILISLLGMIARVFHNRVPNANYILPMLAVVFFIAGIYNQWSWNHFSTRTAWANQKDIWNAIFKAVPDIAPNTVIGLILPDEMAHVEIRAFQSGPFGFSSGLSAFYGKDLHGFFQYSGIKPEQTTNGGIKYDSGYSAAAYDSVVLLEYNLSERKITVLRGFSIKKPDGTVVEIPVCHDCILDHQNDFPLSYLVK